MANLKIEAFAKPDFSAKSGSYEVYINPEKLSHKRSISQSAQESSNTAGTATQHSTYDDEELSFDLHFDATGAIKPVEGEMKTYGVNAEIQKLLAVLYKYEGQAHEPYYLKVSWPAIIGWGAKFEGVKDMFFKGKLSSIHTQYTLFNPDGVPLRALVSVVLKSFIDQKTLEKLKNNSSPDLSHLKTIRIGDKLPVMCDEVYNSMEYYIQIAQANQLINFRNIPLGKRLIFPPLEK